jgi:signal transduction histidine kinase
MKKFAATLFLLYFVLNLAAQGRVDSLNNSLKSATTDSARVKLLVELSRSYYLSKPDSGFYYASKALAIAKKAGDAHGEVHALTQTAYSMWLLGNFPSALQTFLSSLHLARQLNDQWSVARNYDGMSCIYDEEGEDNLAIPYALKSYAIFSQLHDNENMVDELMDLADFNLRQPATALIYGKKALVLSEQINETTWRPQILTAVGNCYAAMGQKKLALYNLRLAADLAIKYNEPFNLEGAYEAIAAFYEKDKQLDSTIFYTKKRFDLSQKTAVKFDVEKSAALLAKLYYGRDNNAAVQYYHIATGIRDSLFNEANGRQVLILNITEQQHEADLQRAALAYQSKLKLYALVGILALVVVILIITWANKEKKARANKLLENTLQELRQTQIQLIQSEKMASLGELTAGIAHEIQNPLNFVNNFSEVSEELIDEMDEELDKGDIKEAKVIAADVKQNLEKIRHHGKRADAIVKGMLQHSQSGTGTKEMTEINPLVDEVMRLAYHGLRAKDKSFNAELVTNFDSKLPAVNIIPQDISRVLLNLFNNAFYAVNQKQKSAGPDYKPEVLVSTSAVKNSLVIKVKDNGNGIPEAVKDKIMQPFFTTKPTGEGTGLGLSLSYDIVVKGHGGIITVDTKEGEFTEFTVTIPII